MSEIILGNIENVQQKQLCTQYFARISFKKVSSYVPSITRLCENTNILMVVFEYGSRCSCNYLLFSSYDIALHAFQP